MEARYEGKIREACANNACIDKNGKIEAGKQRKRPQASSLYNERKEKKASGSREAKPSSMQWMQISRHHSSGRADDSKHHRRAKQSNHSGSAHRRQHTDIAAFTEQCKHHADDRSDNCNRCSKRWRFSVPNRTARRHQNNRSADGNSHGNRYPNLGEGNKEAGLEYCACSGKEAERLPGQLGTLPWNAKKLGDEQETDPAQCCSREGA
ncbi:hypothetical protein GCM10011402_38320 [Paracoccus acridae]|uniref:Uncharacterized protein n=1 Tax=Paracoccus acridae TaxID=1795310 RepID=A0ABQ1VN48_9RHOB|nr:hypothetical protein GCM10011402_38320 [Paracoccus acridae]